LDDKEEEEEEEEEEERMDLYLLAFVLPFSCRNPTLCKTGIAHKIFLKRLNTNTMAKYKLLSKVLSVF
jgi:hypothetical protein